MTDQEFIKRQFEAECREKKRIARGENNRVKSSRGAMKTASDYMTKKQKQLLNGEMVTIDMSKPVDWKTFQTWSEVSQKEYVENLRKTFNVPFSNLMYMFRTNYQEFNKWRKRVGIYGEKGHKKWDRVGWTSFCGGKKELLYPLGYSLSVHHEDDPKTDTNETTSNEEEEDDRSDKIDLTIALLRALMKTSQGAKITIEIEV